MALVRVFEGLFIVVVLGLPVALACGWLQWWKQAKSRDFFSIMSLIGLSLATLSALLALSAAIHAKAIGGFSYYDPSLTRIYKLGMIISRSAIVFSVAGLWKPHTLRWDATVCSVGTLLYWFMQTSAE